MIGWDRGGTTHDEYRATNRAEPSVALGMAQLIFETALRQKGSGEPKKTTDRAFPNLAGSSRRICYGKSASITAHKRTLACIVLQCYPSRFLPCISYVLTMDVARISKRPVRLIRQLLLTRPIATVVPRPLFRA